MYFSVGGLSYQLAITGLDKFAVGLCSKGWILFCHTADSAAGSLLWVLI